MRIKSPVFDENELIPSTYTCEGNNVNPPLEIHEVPPNTQSLVLIIDDPDAAVDPDGPGKTFDHWLIWNIPPTTTQIAQGEVPEGAIEGLNGAGKIGYTGPCPPNGVHHYFFKLYALNKKLDVTPNITKQELLNEIDECLIAKAELVGLYNRNK